MVSLLILAAVIVVAVIVALSLRGENIFERVLSTHKMICCSFFVLAQPSKTTTVTFDDIFNSSFQQKFYSGSWTTGTSSHS